MLNFRFLIALFNGETILVIVSGKRVFRVSNMQFFLVLILQGNDRVEKIHAYNKIHTVSCIHIFHVMV